MPETAVAEKPAEQDHGAWKPQANPWLIAATVALAAFMGGPRHLHRQRGPASHRRQSWRQHRSGHLGAHQLSRLERDHPSRRRLGLIRHRAPQLLHALHHHLYDFELPLRPRTQPSPPVALPRLSGNRRRRSAADGAGHYGGLLRRKEARPGFRSLRPRRRPRPLHRPDHRRMDHRQLLLALDLLHQHSRRHSGARLDPAPRAGSALDQGRP